MRKLYFTFLMLTFISCNQVSKNLESTFAEMNQKLERMTTTQKEKIKNHIVGIKQNANSDIIKIVDSINSDINGFNINLDSLINIVNTTTEKDLNKKTIGIKYKKSINKLVRKLKSRSGFRGVNKQIDSLFSEPKNMEILPGFAIRTELLTGKLNAARGVELLLNEISK